MRAENIIWIGEPTDKYDEKYKMWPQYTLWPFKAKYENRETHQLEPCDTIFHMNETEHEVYLAEKELLKELTHWGIYEGGPARPELIKLIEKYGDRREDKGRYDVHEDWAESDSGSSV